MPVPNDIILFNNHFTGHRRDYPYCTRLAIAADIGYNGYEFHPIEPDDDATWGEATEAYRASGLTSAGMYVLSKGVTDEEFPQIDAEIDRCKRMIDHLAEIDPKAFVNFTIMSNPGGASTPDYREAGSGKAEARHWERSSKIMSEIDAHIATLGLSGNLYNHIWFMCDTSATQLRLIKESGAKTIRPGIAAFHSFFHQGEPDFLEIMDQPGMDNLGYLALLSGWAKPDDPFRTRPLDDGNIDLAAALGLVWQRGYTGPIITQAYDLGGDAYLTAKRSFDYVHEVYDRYQRNPALNPYHK